MTMLATLSQLASPNVTHVIFAAIGGLIAWWMKQPGNPVPPALRPIVELLLARWEAAQQVQAHSALQGLSQPIGSVVGSVEAAMVSAFGPGLTPAAAPAGPGMTPAK